MDQVVAPQTNLPKVNDLYVSLTHPSHNPAQIWTISYSAKSADKASPSGQCTPINKDFSGSWGFNAQSTGFEIRTFNGRVLYVDPADKYSLKVRSRQNNDDEVFFYDTQSKTIKWKKDNLISIAAEFQKDGSYRLVGRRTQGTTPEWFAKPAGSGIIMLAANKNYIWKAPNRDGARVTVVKGTGSLNWKNNGNYFKLVDKFSTKQQTCGLTQTKAVTPSADISQAQLANASNQTSSVI